MSDVQVKIDTLLADAGPLKSLLDEMIPLRQRTDVLHHDLEQARRDYDHHLKQLNIEAERLLGLKRSLQSRLARRPKPLPAREGTTLPETIIDLAVEVDVPPPLLEDSRTMRKRILADHIFYFMDTSQLADIEIINAILSDDQRDVGDMLELLTWGDIWKSRPDWETFEQQLERLLSWRVALEERLGFWHQEIRRLESDPNYGLVRIMASSSREAWLAHLDNLAQQQSEENRQLAEEISILEERLQEQ